MRSDVLVYISGPISASDDRRVEENVLGALAVHIKLTQLGVPSICPHLGAMFPSCHSDVPYETWMALDFAVLARCTHMLVIGDSPGTRRETAYALERRIPVSFGTRGLLEVLHDSETRG